MNDRPIVQPVAVFVCGCLDSGVHLVSVADPRMWRSGTETSVHLPLSWAIVQEQPHSHAGSYYSMQQNAWGGGGGGGGDPGNEANARRVMARDNTEVLLV